MFLLFFLNSQPWQEPKILKTYKNHQKLNCRSQKIFSIQPGPNFFFISLLLINKIYLESKSYTQYLCSAPGKLWWKAAANRKLVLYYPQLAPFTTRFLAATKVSDLQMSLNNLFVDNFYKY